MTRERTLDTFLKISQDLGGLWAWLKVRLKAQIPYFTMIKHLGSKSGNLTQYQWKRWQHRFVGFLEKSQNQAYVYEKCILMGTFLGGKSFDIVVWKNKVDGTQNFDISWKSALEVAKPTIENRKYHENPIDSKIWSRYPNKARSSAKII